MSKFANTFLKSLNEEKEGNAFTAKLAKTKKGGTFEINGKKVKDTSNYDDHSVKKEEKEGNAFTAKLAKTKKGGTFEINGKKVKDTSNYDDHSVKNERKMEPYAIGMAAAKKKAGVTKHHNLPKSVIKKGHEIGKKIAKMHKENVMPAMEAEADMAAPGGDEEAAWKASLDKGTNPKDFDTQDNPQISIDSSGVEAARSWVSKLEEMAEFVNGTGPESLNSKINDLELKNSVPFRGVVRREEKRITKLAENLRGLAEVFKSVIIGSQKKIQDATGPR